MPSQRRTSHLIIAEGEDDEALAEALSRDLDLTVDVIKAGSKDAIRDKVGAAIKMPGPRVTRVCIVRDAEGDAARQFQSSADALDAYGFPRPERPMQVATDDKARGLVIVNPPDSESGTIEDLMLRAVANPATLACAEEFHNCLDGRDVARFQNAVVRKKSLVQAYLAGMAETRTDHRIYLGLWRDAFHLDADVLKPIRDTLREIFS